MFSPFCTEALSSVSHRGKTEPHLHFHDHKPTGKRERNIPLGIGKLDREMRIRKGIKRVVSEYLCSMFHVAVTEM